MLLGVFSLMGVVGVKGNIRLLWSCVLGVGSMVGVVAVVLSECEELTEDGVGLMGLEDKARVIGLVMTT